MTPLETLVVTQKLFYIIIVFTKTMSIYAIAQMVF
jgi:hypothetical protein